MKFNEFKKRLNEATYDDQEHIIYEAYRRMSLDLKVHGGELTITLNGVSYDKPITICEETIDIQVNVGNNNYRRGRNYKSE